MGSWQRQLVESLGLSVVPDYDSWVEILAGNLVSINGHDVIIGTKGSWARRILENYPDPLPPGSWETKLKYLFDNPSTVFVVIGGGGGTPSIGGIDAFGGAFADAFGQDTFGPLI